VHERPVAPTVVGLRKIEQLAATPRIPTSPTMNSSPLISLLESCRFDAVRAHPALAAERDDLLLWACSHADERTVKFLLENGANPAYNDDWPLYCACEYGCTDIVRLLLNVPAVREHAHSNRNRCLISAEREGYTEIVDMLSALPTVASGPSLSKPFFGFYEGAGAAAPAAERT
jgi:ankyrin repeat protein